jgi:prevent-host-death family protein
MLAKRNATSGDVLLVGHQTAAREQFRKELGEAGFSVTSVRDSRKAVEELHRRTFDLLLLDVAMPEMSGLDLLQSLREKMDLPRTILLAEEFSNDLRIQEDELDAISLKKPVRVENIVRLFHSRRAHRRHPRALARRWARSLPATQAKNAFSGALETAIHTGPVLITKHNKPGAVLISYDDYVRSHQSPLGKLADEFDALLENMQQPAARSGMAAAFNASPEELGQAALKGAKRRG